MQVVDVISNRALMDVLDSLNDSAESLRNAADVSEGEAKTFFDTYSLKFDNVADALYNRAELSHDDINVIIEALLNSIDNAAELMLDDARESYEQSLVEVRDVERV